MPEESHQGFDRLSPNGVGCVFCSFVFPIILSLSMGRLSPNGVGGRAKLGNISKCLFIGFSP